MNNINEKDATMKISNDVNDNSYQIINPLKAQYPEFTKKEKLSMTIDNVNKAIEFNGVNNYLSGKTLISYENNNIKEKISFNKGKKIFKVVTNKTHTGDDIDNIKQMIIRDFINFFIAFINFIIEKTMPQNQKIRLQIGFQLKNKIKIEDINNLTVEELLIFKNTTMKNLDGKENEEKIKKIRNIIGNCLDQLLKTEVFYLFKNIYAKKIQNESDKEIDLNQFGLNGIIFKLDEKIPFFQKKLQAYKDKKIKVKLMEKIVDKLINNKKKILFDVK
jgi:hypothetical protein